MPSPFLVMATQNPIESEGTYPLPEAQVDRFMLKIVVDYPHEADELTVIERALAEPGRPSSSSSRSRSSPSSSSRRAASTSTRPSRATRSRSRSRRASSPTTGSRSSRSTSRTAPARAGRSTSCSAPARSPLLRGRRYALPQDVRELAKDVLRHRMVLSYEALAEGVEADTVLDRVLEAIEMPHARPRPRGRRVSATPRPLAPVRTPGAARPGAAPGRAAAPPRADGAQARSTTCSPATTARGRSATAPSSRRCGRTSSATTCAASTGT